jgi:cathepsin X
MSIQLLNHHALTCGLTATTKFKAYTGGVFSETSVIPKIDHWVELVGEGTDYWVGRNSWGTTWGIGGFFKIKKGGDNLGV